MAIKLNDLETEYVKGQVRQDLRRQDRGRSQLKRKFGEQADYSRVDARTKWLQDFYEKLGGHVESISNRHQK